MVSASEDATIKVRLHVMSGAWRLHQIFSVMISASAVKMPLYRQDYMLCQVSGVFIRYFLSWLVSASEDATLKVRLHVMSGAWQLHPIFFVMISASAVKMPLLR